MSYPGLNTYMINSHGDACSPGATIQLPKNVFVIMNCKPELTYTNHLIDAFLWRFACKYKLDNKPFSKSKVEVYKRYIGSMLSGLKSALHNPHSLTEFCLFSGSCPNIVLSFREDKFRTGIYQLPVKITYNGDSPIDTQQFDTYIDRMNVIADMEGLESFYVKHNLEDNAQRIKSYSSFYDYFYGLDTSLKATRNFLTNDEDFNVSHQLKTNLSLNANTNLADVVQQLSEKDPKSLHFIVLNACRLNTSIDNEQSFRISINHVKECVDKVIEIVNKLPSLSGGKRSTKKNTSSKVKTATKKKPIPSKKTARTKTS